MTEGMLTQPMLDTLEKKFKEDPTNRLAMNAVTRTSLQDIALNRDVLVDADFTFNHEVDSGEITDQARAGTCWMFAELNWMRTFTQKKFKIKAAHFSENYLMFFDKLEKANYFLEAMIELRDRDRDDRYVHFLLGSPIGDGGEWHLIVNLIKKYGVIPFSAMPDSFNRSNSRFMNEVLAYKLREAAAKIRQAHRAGRNIAFLRKIKEETMDVVYRILVICMGLPPKKIDFAFKDEDKKFQRDTGLTPKEFFEKYIGFDFDTMYTLWSCPSEVTPFHQTYTVEYFDNMVGGTPWKCLNLPIGELKKICVKSLKKEEAALFGCDVLQECNTKEGILYGGVYDYDIIFQTDFTMTKQERLDYRQSFMTHSMVFTGLDMVDNKPTKWKVENSWGDKVGKKGFFIMSDKWFDEHVYDLVTFDKYLTKKFLKEFEKDPVLLPPWFPMT
ncbi:C1 family peptidase [bacterium]|nr:C1 family peptidase [candidate division CSSED10-310 bacterium]